MQCVGVGFAAFFTISCHYIDDNRIVFLCFEWFASIYFLSIFFALSQLLNALGDSIR